MANRIARIALITLAVLAIFVPLAGAKMNTVPPGEVWAEAASEARAGDLAAATRTIDRLVHQSQVLRVRRYPLFAEAAVSLAIEGAARNDPAMADWGLKTALELDAGSPQVPFAAAEIARMRGDWPGAFRGVLRGIPKVFSTTEAAIVARADLTLSLLFALVVAIAVFAISLVLRYGRPAVHDFRELLSGKMGAGAATLLGFALLFLPIFLWLGPGWLLIYWIMLLFAYANAAERTLSVVLLIVVILLPLPAEWAGYRLSGVETPVVQAAIASRERSYHPEVVRRLRELVALMPEQARLHLLLGNLMIQEGNEQEALIHYQKAAELDDHLAGAQLNLGNIYFLGTDWAAASVRYERASQIDPNMAAAYYNQSVAAGEQFNFDLQGRSLEQAKNVDRGLVERIVANPPPGKVVWYDLPLSSAWDLAGTISAGKESRSLFGNYIRFAPGIALANPLSVGTLIALVLMITLWAVRRKSGLAGSCVKCGRTFCPRCKSSRESATYCTQCIHIYLKRDGVAMDAKKRKVDEVQRHHVASARTRKLMTTFLPGSASLLEGSAWRGILLLVAFFLLVSIAILTGRLAPIASPATATIFIVRISAIALAVILWAITSIPVYRQRTSG